MTIRLATVILLFVWLSVQSYSQDIFSNNFNDFTLPSDSAEQIPYTEQDLIDDWNSPVWSNGVEEGENRTSIVDGGNGDPALAVSYPANSVGTDQTGAQWRLIFNNSYEAVELSYRFRFGPDFGWSRGGKLPGLGGSRRSNNSTNDSKDAWAGRIMWRENGTAISYALHKESGTNSDGKGEDRDEWAGFKFVPERWYQFTQRIRMNTPGVNDGVIELLIDGQRVYYRDDIRWRDAADLQINQMYFSTFFGGSDDTWNTTKDEVIYFDDFEISELAEEPTPEEPTPEEPTPEEPTPEEPTPEEPTPEEPTPEEPTPEEPTPEEPTPEEPTPEEPTPEEPTPEEPTPEEPTPEDRGPIFIKVPDDYASIQQALDAAIDGDTIAIKGSHDANVVITKSVLFRGYNGTKIFAQNSSMPAISVQASDVTLFRLELEEGGVEVTENRSNVTISNVDVTNADKPIRVLSGCTNCVINKCDITNNNGIGILVSGVEGLTISNSDSNENSGGGLLVSDSENVEVIDSDFRDNIGDGLIFESVFLGFITDNKSYDNIGDGFVLNSSQMISIEDNRSRRNTGYGYLDDSSDDNSYQDNDERRNDGGASIPIDLLD